LAVLNPALNGQLRPKREDVRLSLNFRLDPTLTKAGRIFVSIKTLTDAATGAEVACTNCAEQLQVTFVESPPLRIQLILFGYNTNDPLKTHRPTGRDVFNFWSWLKRTFPVSDVLVEARMVEANFSPPFDVESLTCNIANAQLAAIRNLDIDGGTDQRFHYYGMVADSGGFMRGCANSIPNTPDHSAVASGPTGTGYAWDGDGSYGDWYGGHELAHTFGRLHPGFCDGNTRDDPDYPFERGQLSNADGVFVGFDVGGVKEYRCKPCRVSAGTTL
jgi:hypothetical protein